MRACTFVLELWRTKQLNLTTSMHRTIGYCPLHSAARFSQLPLTNEANQEVTGQVCALRNSLLDSSIFQRRRFFSFAPSQTNENEIARSQEKAGSTAETNSANQTGPPDKNSDSGAIDSLQSSKRRRKTPKRTKFSDSDSDSENELSRDDLVKLLVEKEELLKKKHEEMEIVQDKALRSFSETENVISRTKREAENSKKFAIQAFAKSLLDVADNLGRASSVVRERFTKIDTKENAGGAMPLLKTLLEGVEMTEKQLAEVFKKFGVERYDPVNEQFDPNRHNALFQVPDPSKPPNTVAVVMKPGYMLHERIIRPAEVGVTVGVEEGSRT